MDLVPDPWAALARWMDEAVASEPDVPEAMQLATVGPDGRPALRTVLLRGHGPDGLVFYTNLGSRKARHLLANGRAAALLHWKSLQRQVIAEGSVAPVTDAEADAYWATRPRGSQLGGWASRQSEPLARRGDLDARIAELDARFEGTPVPRPPFWGGFRLRPDRIELWQGRPDRLHDRHLYTVGPDGWSVSLLQP